MFRIACMSCNTLTDWSAGHDSAMHREEASNLTCSVSTRIHHHITTLTLSSALRAVPLPPNSPSHTALEGQHSRKLTIELQLPSKLHAATAHLNPTSFTLQCGPANEPTPKPKQCKQPANQKLKSTVIVLQKCEMKKSEATTHDSQTGKQAVQRSFSQPHPPSRPAHRPVACGRPARRRSRGEAPFLPAPLPTKRSIARSGSTVVPAHARLVLLFRKHVGGID